MNPSTSHAGHGASNSRKSEFLKEWMGKEQRDRNYCACGSRSRESFVQTMQKEHMRQQRRRTNSRTNDRRNNNADDDNNHHRSMSRGSHRSASVSLSSLESAGNALVAESDVGTNRDIQHRINRAYKAVHGGNVVPSYREARRDLSRTSQDIGKHAAEATPGTGRSSHLGRTEYSSKFNHNVAVTAPSMTSPLRNPSKRPGPGKPQTSVHIKGEPFMDIFPRYRQLQSELTHTEAEERLHEERLRQLQEQQRMAQQEASPSS